MSVPLDNLYDWVEGLMPEPAFVYVFRPHGSKKISNLRWIKLYENGNAYNQSPAVILHDQEPLDWEFYNQSDQYLDYLNKSDSTPAETFRFAYCSNFNLKSYALAEGAIIYDQAILVHSEKNSTDLAQYQQNGFLTVHYWAHAVIARDWYRFAEFDPRLDTCSQPKNKFLIYCRDWSHRREYRLKFLELLVQNNLHHDSQTNVMHVNGEGTHFSQHKFINSAFELTQPELISKIAANTFSSTASADYDYGDFVNNQISIVLETVFDDSRIHLTEKTLRPIACGHPFILAAGPGALEYVRSYGFKTFAPWIDESYDQETNSLCRMEKIIKAMRQIQNLSRSELEDFCQAMKAIVDHNKKHFFSDEFFNIVKNELESNLAQAYVLVKQTRGKHYLELLRSMKKQKLEYPAHVRLERTRFLRQLRQSYLHGQSNSQEDQTV